MSGPGKASDERSVRALYQDVEVAERYLDERFTVPWGRLLHERQVGVLNRLVAGRRIRSVLELAPGPARIAVELRGIEAGLMIDESAPMLDVAERRLRDAGLLGTWSLRRANAFDLDSLGEPFDLVFSFRFIRHFGPEDRLRLYRAIAGRLRPGGLLVFDVVNRAVRERIDAHRKKDDPRELPVHDALYDETEFRREMEASGFRVVEMVSVVRHFDRQASWSYGLARRLPRVATALVNLVERIPSRTPLEWVAVCERGHQP